MGGFTILDLLVSLAVTAVLLSMLAPALMGAQEAARRVQCASNIRQIGLGIQMYAFENRDEIPSSELMDGPGQDNPAPQDTIFIRFQGDPRVADGALVWDGLGLLTQDFITQANTYYCPSHTGSHDFEQYEEEWTSGVGAIASNYQYRAHASMRRFSLLDPEAALVADGVRTLRDYSHKVGNNVLLSDLSVHWYADTSGVIRAALADSESEPSPTGPVDVRLIWNELDGDKDGAPAPDPGTPN